MIGLRRGRDLRFDPLRAGFFAVFFFFMGPSYSLTSVPPG
jgi:hypothetical protein